MGGQKVPKTLETGLYNQLLNDLENFRDNSPATHLASRLARKVTARLVDKSAKRLRHAAETVTGIHGNPSETSSKPPSGTANPWRPPGQRHCQTY
jgi:hypothetical protein